MDRELIVLAILAKDKAHCLPRYLKAIEDQTYPKKKLAIWIRSNNNNDDTISILKKWVKANNKLYHSIKTDYTDVEEQVQDYGPHEWNEVRFQVLGKLRNEAVDYAKSLKAHYMVVDCDNFILPHVIETLYDANLPVVGPMLRREVSNSAYANYHYLVNDNGYYVDHPIYYSILNRELKGLIQVPVVKSTYLIRAEHLKHVQYLDETERYNYVIFSDFLRQNNVIQYLDNREDHGFLTFAVSDEELAEEPRIQAEIEDEDYELDEEIIEL